jgi:hypothetical protein
MPNIPLLTAAPKLRTLCEQALPQSRVRACARAPCVASRQIHAVQEEDCFLRALRVHAAFCEDHGSLSRPTCVHMQAGRQAGRPPGAWTLLLAIVVGFCLDCFY